MPGLRQSAGLHAAAALAGAGGMGVQACALAAAGLSAGQSFAGAYGPGAYVIGWAAGAAVAGRWSKSGAWSSGFFAAWLATALATLLLRTGSEPAALFACVALALAALPSGFFLPLAARSHASQRPAARLGSLLAANLFGALGGAWAIGYELTSVAGRTTALWASAALLASAFALGGASSRAASDARAPRAPAAWDVAAGIVVAATTLWTLGLEWICMRVAVMWVGSEAAQMTRVVALSLLALALGSALSRFLPRGRRALAGWLAVCALASIWPLVSAPVLGAAREGGDVAVTLALVLPTLAPFGAILPLLHASAEGEAGRRLGDLLSFEVLGALVAGPLLHALLVPRWGIAGTLAALCSCAVLSITALAVRERAWRTAAALGLACAGIGALAAGATPPALRSPKLVDPALEVLSFREDEHFSVTVVDDGILGERTVLTDQFRAAGTGPDYRYMRALGHLPVLLHPSPRRVAVLALGTGTTLGAVALHSEVERIDVLEISSAVVDAAPFFRSVNQGALEPGNERVQVIIDDGRRTLARSAGAYDVVTMEPLLPDSPFGVYLYTPEFYAVARASLAPGGVFCQWLPPHALAPDSFEALLAAFASSFDDARAWLCGTQVVLTGATAAPTVSPERFQKLDELCRAALAELGLHTPEGLASRHVASLEAWRTPPARPLRDSDPWIAWRSKPTDLRVLRWLPSNLESLLFRSSTLAWGGGLDEALVGLREARIAQAWAEVELREGTLDADAAKERALLGAEAIPPAARRDPEVRAFVDEVLFLHGLRAGVAALKAGDARAALMSFLSAAERRPERGDVHAYVATALWVGGNEPAARAAAERARTTCPRIVSTTVGQRCVALGLPAGLLAAPDATHRPQD